MSDHTPGPWAVNFTKFSEVRAENGAVIARCLKLTSLTNLEANARRIVACVNACEGVSTKHLENNLPIRELVTRYNEALREIEALKNGRTELVNALGELVGEIKQLADESCGVAGLHLNGDVAAWEEILPGGRFEWLGSLERAESAIAKAARVDCVGTAEDLV